MSVLSRNNIEKLDYLINNISQRIKFAIEGDINKVNDMGMNYYFYSIISKFVGSPDYYNTIHIFSDIFNPNPMSLVYIKDPINYGYINADLKNFQYLDNTDGQVYFNYAIQFKETPDKSWTINFKPPIPYWFHDGNFSNFNQGEHVGITSLPMDYPEWNGWPIFDQSSSELQYPINKNNIRFPVFYLSKYIKITNNDISNITYDNTIQFAAKDIITSSFLDTDYEDIRIFRIKIINDIDTNFEPVISGYFEEVPRKIDNINNLIYFQISSDNTFIIEPNKICYYILYWRSPDNYITNYSLPSYSSDNNAVDYSIDFGLYYNYFYKYRHDVINFENTKAILKIKDNTNYISNEVDKKLYEPLDPLFYLLSSINGNIDDYYKNYIVNNLNNELDYYNGFSINSRNILGQYPDFDSVYGVVIGIKSYFDLLKYSTIYYDFVKGPDIFPDMFPFDWKDYNYYPNIDKDFLPFAKIIVGQKNNNEINQNSPRSKIIYIEYTYSYGNRGINNLSLIYNLNSVIQLLYKSYFNISKSGIFSNIIFSTYFLILSLDIDEITSSKILLNILRSHEKYIFNGSLNNIQEITMSSGANNIFDLNNIYSVSSDIAFSSYEMFLDSINTEPWFMSLNYWKNPSNILHENNNFKFLDGTNWVSSVARGVDTSRILLQYNPGDINYDDNLLLFNPNDHNTILQNRDDASQTGLYITNFNLNIQNKLEINFPKPSEYINTDIDALNQDYTFDFKFLDKFNNIIFKEIFLPNANYYISDNEYLLKTIRGESVIGYLTPSIVWKDINYDEYGEAYFMPNCRNGSSREIFMKVFDPDDPNVKSISEIISSCQTIEDPEGLRNLGGHDAVVANEDIKTCVRDAIDNYGVDTIDLRTISSKVKGIKEFWLGITKYTTSESIWKNDFNYLGGITEINPNTGQLENKIRYGFKIDSDWYYQSFTQNDVINIRLDFVNTHLLANSYVKSQIRHDLFDDIDFALNGHTLYLAQTFSSDFSELSNKIINIQCWMKRVGSVDASVICKIYSISDSKIIAESIAIEFNSISEDQGWITFEFSTSVTIPTNTEQYMIIITSIEDPSIVFSSHNKLIWYFASDNTYAYGMTSVYSFITLNIVSGSSAIIVENSLIFPSTPFFILIENDLYYISSKDNNTLYLSDYDYNLSFDTQGNNEYPEYTWYINSVSKNYTSGTIVSLVNFIPLDPENRFYKEKLDSDGGIISAWLLPQYSNHDASYRIMCEGYDIGPVENPNYNEWFGNDIINNDFKSINLDSFYITGQSASYDTSQQWGGQTGSKQNLLNNFGYSWGNNLIPPIINSKILGGFNTSGVNNFPKQNNIRVSTSNKIDRYWAWGTTKLDIEDKIIVLPQSFIMNDNINYIPFYNNIFLTIGLVRAGNTRKVINKVLFGFNNDYGTINSVVDNKTLIVNSSTFTSVDANQFSRKILKIMSGNDEGNEILITSCSNIGGGLYTIELLLDMKNTPDVGDSYCIPYTTIKMYDYGTITDVNIDLVTGYTTITDNTKSWSINQYIGYTLWFISGNIINTEIVISQNTSNALVIINMLIDPSIGLDYIIFSNDNLETGVYGTNGPIVIDNIEKFISIDHMYISADGFPKNYMDGMGYTDAFIVRSKVDATV